MEDIQKQIELKQKAIENETERIKFVKNELIKANNEETRLLEDYQKKHSKLTGKIESMMTSISSGSEYVSRLQNEIDNLKTKL